MLIEAKEIARKTIGRLGFELRRLQTPLPLEVASPFDAINLTPVPYAYTCRVPISKIYRHPSTTARVEMLNMYTRNGSRAARSSLKRWYLNHAPSSVADNLDIESSLPFHRLPATHTTLPWSSMDPFEAQAHRYLVTLREGREHGFDVTLADGFIGFGPISDRLLDQEVSRLTAIFEAIRQLGYDPKHGLIQGQIYAVAGQYRVRPIIGLHRTAAMLALDTTSIEMEFRTSTPVVRRDEVAHWPNVRRGFFTSEEALSIFDQHFAPLTLD